MKWNKSEKDNMEGPKMAKTRFGQLVIGPPGAGKTTYVGAMTQMLRGMGRKVAIVNMDPANENMTYQPEVDVADLVRLEEVMDTMDLGPNGGLVYCMQFLLENYSWLEGKLQALDPNTYLMIDCPGQVRTKKIEAVSTASKFESFSLENWCLILTSRWSFIQ